MAKLKPTRKRSRKRKRYSVHPGAAPGIIVENPNAERARVRLVGYDENGFEEIDDPELASVANFRSKWSNVWIDISSCDDTISIRKVAEIFHLHPLSVEDAVNRGQRPKCDRYKDHLYVVLRLPADDEQISVFLGAGFVVTIQEREGDCFDPVRERVRDGRGRIRGWGSDYLAYALIDSAIDSHFPLLEQIGDQLEDLEDEIIGGRGSDAPRKIQSIRGRLRNMGRTHYPHSDVVRTLLHPETPYVAEETRPFLRDCLDHAVRVADQIDNYRDESSDLMHLHMASISNKMNEVMKVLTIMAAIFIPLSFIAGIYGMNFEADVPWNMPELRWKWGYPTVLGVMAAVALGLLAFFRRRGWF